MRVVSAVVLDAGTGNPVEGASIRERHDNRTYEAHQDLTNAEGLFEFSDLSGGLRRCPPVQLHVAKAGYVPLDRVCDAGTRGDTVRLRRDRAF